MDFDGLPRRDLQALCKRNRIPANMTNVAMAEALKALPMVEGLEEIRERMKFQTPKKAEAPSPGLPATGRRTLARQRVIQGEAGDVPASAPTRTRWAAAKASEINKMVAAEGDGGEKEEGNEVMPETPMDRASPLPRSRRVSARASEGKRMAAVEGQEEGEEEQEKQERVKKITETPAASIGQRTTRRRGQQGAAVEVRNTPATRRKASVAQKVVEKKAEKEEEEEEEKEEKAAGARTTSRRTRQSSRKQQPEEVMSSSLVTTRRSTRTRAAVKMEALSQEGQEDKGEMLLISSHNVMVEAKDSSVEVEESRGALDPVAADEDEKGEGDQEIQSTEPSHQLAGEIDNCEGGSVHRTESEENPKVEDKKSGANQELLPSVDDQRGELDVQEQEQEEQDLVMEAEAPDERFNPVAPDQEGEQELPQLNLEAKECQEEQERTNLESDDEGLGPLELISVEESLRPENRECKPRGEESELCESDDSPIKGLVVTSEQSLEGEANAVQNHDLKPADSSAEITFKGSKDHTVQNTHVACEDSSLCDEILMVIKDSLDQESSLEIGANAATAIIADITSIPEALSSDNQLMLGSTVEEAELSSNDTQTNQEIPSTMMELLTESLATLDVNGRDVILQSADDTTALAATENLIGNVIVAEHREEGSEEESKADGDKEKNAMDALSEFIKEEGGGGREAKTEKQNLQKIDLQAMSLRKLKSLYKEKLASKNSEKVEDKRAALTSLDENCL